MLVIVVGLAAYWLGVNNSRFIITKEGTQIDPATGLAFFVKEKFSIMKQPMSLLGVGTRKKLILNVYSLGFYASEPLFKEIEKKRKTAANPQPDPSICESLLRSKHHKAVKMIFNMEVGPDKIAEAVSQLVDVDKAVVDAFHEMVLTGLNGKMVKEENMTFEWKGDDVLLVSARGKRIGEMKNKSLARAVLELYVGSKSVSPSLRSHLGCGPSP